MTNEMSNKTPQSQQKSQAIDTSVALNEAEQYIAARIAEAARTFLRLPTHKPAGYRGYWPDVLQSYQDVFANAVAKGGKFEDLKVKLGPPTGEAIDRAVEVAVWMLHVRQEFGVKCVAMLWQKALGKTWDFLEAKHNKSHMQLKRYRKQAIIFMLLRLQMQEAMKQRKEK